MVSTSQEAVKVFSSQVHKVRVKIGLPCSDLSLDRKDDRAEALRANGGSSKDKLPTYQIFQTDETGAVVYDSKGKPVIAFSGKMAHNKLSTKLDSIQADFMVASGDKGLWYMPSSQVDEFNQRLEELKTLRDDVLDELCTSKNYHKAKMIYEQALFDALEPDEVDVHINKFPAINELAERFIVEILECEPLPSLSELMEKADKDASAKLQLEAVQRVMDDLKSKAPSIISECYEKFAKMLDLVERQKALDESDLCKKYAERVNVLLELWKATFSSENKDLQTMLQDVYLLAEKTAKLTEESDVEDACNELRALWRTGYQLGHSEGALELSKWLYPERGLESQITTLIQQIKDELDEDKRNKLEKRLHRLKDLLTYKVDSINQQIVWLTGSAEEPEQQEVIAVDDGLATERQLNSLTTRLLRGLYKPLGDASELVKPELVEKLLEAKITVDQIEELKNQKEEGF